jgi:hypothetical protein
VSVVGLFGADFLVLRLVKNRSIFHSIFRGSTDF